jgi:hypothetical protein
MIFLINQIVEGKTGLKSLKFTLCLTMLVVLLAILAGSRPPTRRLSTLPPISPSPCTWH